MSRYVPLPGLTPLRFRMSALRWSWSALSRKGCSWLRVAVLLFCPDQPVTAAEHIDHIIVGTSDLVAAVTEIERITGVRPVLGGTHPGHGTRNALMSIGPMTYLELLAPNPDAPIASKEIASLKALRRMTPIGWAVSSVHLPSVPNEPHSSNLSVTKPEPGSRLLPDGSVLHWSTFRYAEPASPNAPFFIQWNNISLHPSRTSPKGCRLLSLHIGDPRAADLRSALDPLKLPVEIERANAHAIRLRIRCPKGLVTFS